MRNSSKKLAYYIANVIREQTICTPEERKELYALLCNSLNNLESVAHIVTRYMEPQPAEIFISTYYHMFESSKTKLEPEVIAALIAGGASLVTAAITYSSKQDILRQCRSNMYFETSGGVWSTTSSQKFAGILPDMLK